jgi:hypothetical protein
MTDVLGPYHSKDLMSPYDVANALNTLNNQIGSGGGGGGGASVSSANFVSTLALGKTTMFPAVVDGGPEWVITKGYAAIDDNGGMLSTRISSPPTGTTAGTWSSADGQLWLYVLTGTEVHVNAFGASRRAGDSDFAVDSLQAFKDCRDWILRHCVGAANYTGVTLVFDGYYYCSKAFSTGNGNYNVKGQSRDSRITTPWPYDQIIVQGGSSFGREGWAYTSAFPIYYGQRVSVGNHIYVAVTPGTPTLNGSTAPSGTGLGQIDGTVIWNYEREKTFDEQQTGAFNGTIERLTVASNWSAFTPHSHNTEATKPSDDQNNLATEGAYFAGILGRSRCTLREVSYFGQPGMGLAFVGDGDPYIRGPANVNDWRIDRCGGGFLAWNGIHIGLSDANAGVAIDIDSVDCGAFGIANFAFLDNKFYGTQHDGDGQFFRGFSKYPTSAVHRGYHWMVRLPELGVDNLPLYLNEEPGAAPVSLRKPWIRWEGDGTISYASISGFMSGNVLNVTAKTGSNLNVGSVIYDGGISGLVKISSFGTGTGGNGSYNVTGSGAGASISPTTFHVDTFDDGNYAPWDPTQRYMPGGSHGNNSFNNCGTVFGQYNESGTWPAQYGVKDIVIGTILQGLYDTTRGNLVLEAGVWRRSVMAEARYSSDTGVKFRTVGIGAVPVDGQQSARADSPVLFYTDYDGTYYELGSSAENETGTTGDRTLHNDLDWGPLNQLKWLRMSGKNTLRDYDRGVPFPYASHIPNFILGDGFLGGRRVFTVESIPTGGPFTVGDVAIPKHPVIGQPKAWTCTAAPDTSHSTWTSWGNL